MTQKKHRGSRRNKRRAQKVERAKTASDYRCAMCKRGVNDAVFIEHDGQNYAVHRRCVKRFRRVCAVARKALRDIQKVQRARMGRVI